MKKLVLEIETLKVESFATDVARNADGTVRAHQWEWGGDIIYLPADSAGCSDGCSHTCGSGGEVCCA